MPLDLEACRDYLSAQPLRPLFATVSGAHLYGFESPDSDIDLRGVFVLPVQEVVGLRIVTETQTVNSEIDGTELDFVAHDVHKFCTMLTRRNGYVLEQLFSPLVVVGGSWFEELREIARGCRTRYVHHHYRGFFHNQLRLLDRSGTVKELLYAYRVVLTGIHYLRTGETEAHLPSLMAAHPDPRVSQLIERKRSGVEQQQLEAGELDAHRPRLKQLAERLDHVFEGSSLPEDIQNFPQLNDFVVRARLEFRGRG